MQHINTIALLNFLLLLALKEFVSTQIWGKYYLIERTLSKRRLPLTPFVSKSMMASRDTSWWLGNTFSTRYIPFIIGDINSVEHHFPEQVSFAYFEHLVKHILPLLDDLNANMT